MAFKVDLTPTYQTSVSVEIPNDGGSVDKSTFSVKFKRYSVLELEGDDGKGGFRQLSQPEVLRQAVTGWGGISSDDGTVFDFSADNLEIMMRIPQVLKALAEAFWTTQYGAKQKN
ncbi:hypothetical protein [Methylophilus sp. Leaf414]|uniref:hypothetical protein n=1 Tax=Methylophilus sp. Leaf414 TaxID=1736371 RepID=UPI0006F2909E|nr:hypothetical protein [Methylophilus sp. Leaf414]KQT37676.1 hypothetical protein ASG24_01385 [Methylophilus sp. Leaf414]